MLILDNDGNRILAKYYDKNVFPTVKEQKQYEKNLFNKTHRANSGLFLSHMNTNLGLNSFFARFRNHHVRRTDGSL